MSHATPRDSGHVMPKSDEGFVRGILKLPSSEQVPVRFLKLYWASRNLADRVNLGIGAMDRWHLIQLAIMSGADVSDAPPPTIIELWRDKVVKKGERCTFEYRNDRLEGRIESIDIQRHRATVSSPKFNRPLEVDAGTVELIPKKTAAKAKA